MAEPIGSVQTQTTYRGAAVDGLLAGAGAGLAMAAYLVAAGMMLGEGPGTMLGRFDPNGAASPLTGGLAHLAVAAVYGALFGGAWRVIRLRRRDLVWGLACGLIYGLLLWAVAAGAFLPLAGAGVGLAAVPGLHLATAHVVYGLALGALFHRHK